MNTKKISNWPYDEEQADVIHRGQGHLGLAGDHSRAREDVQPPLRIHSRQENPPAATSSLTTK